jgi:hypothetical protein
VEFPLWNHRVVKKEGGYGIHEVYYKEDGTIQAVTKDAIDPYGETLEDLRLELQRMVGATFKDVLDYDRDFPNTPKPVSRKPKKKPRLRK